MDLRRDDGEECGLENDESATLYLCGDLRTLAYTFVQKKQQDGVMAY